MKIRKGQYGYRDQHKKSRALLTGLFVAAIIAQLIARQLTSEQAKSTSYQALLQAYADYQQKNLDDAALELQNVQADVLSDAQKTIYNTISQAVSSGNTGSDDTSGDGSDDSGDYDESDYDE